MFNTEHVETLFASTRAGIARSYQLLEERRPPSAAIAAAASSPRPGLLRVPPALELAALPFEPTLRTLEGLSHLGALTEVSHEMVTRLEAEATQPSPAIVKQRAKGVYFPLTRRMVKAATVAAAQGASMEGDAQQLWTDGALLTAQGEHDQPHGQASDGCGDAGVGGAVISSALVLCAFCVDAAHLLSSSAESTTAATTATAPSAQDEELVGLFGDLAMAIPAPLLSTTLRTMTSLLRPSHKAHTTATTTTPASTLPLALLYFPSLTAHTLLYGAPSVAAEAVFRPLEAEAHALLPTYLHSERDFNGKAEACALFFAAVAHALLVALVTPSTRTRSRTLVSVEEDTSRRVLSCLKQLVTVFVTPVETTFTASVARPGMTAAVYASLVAPLSCHVNAALSTATTIATQSGGARRVTGSLEMARALLHTGVYRLLMVIESAGASELYVASGKASAVAQQKQYQERLRQSNGKLTTSIFSSLVEDRQLLLQETNARSEGGHRVLKITNGVSSDPAVFAYVDDGAVFVKHGRFGKFRSTTSVEEVFKVFDAS